MNRGTKAFLVLVSAFCAVPWSAYVLMRLWGWFIIPVGMPAITLWQSAGVNLTASFLVLQLAKKDASETDYLFHALKVWIAPAMALGLGALYAWLGQ